MKPGDVRVTRGGDLMLVLLSDHSLRNKVHVLPLSLDEDSYTWMKPGVACTVTRGWLDIFTVEWPG